MREKFNLSGDKLLTSTRLSITGSKENSSRKWKFSYDDLLEDQNHIVSGNGTFFFLSTFSSIAVLSKCKPINVLESSAVIACLYIRAVAHVWFGSTK